MSVVVPPPIQRAPFTADVLTALRTLPIPVGDGQLPKGANWIGQPNLPASNFAGYVVLSEIVASHSSGGFADSQGNWQLPYLVESFGISREACGTIADRARAVMAELRSHVFVIGTPPDDVRYGVQQVRVDSIGEPVRVASVKPPIWHTQDGITLWIGKGA